MKPWKLTFIVLAAWWLCGQVPQLYAQGTAFTFQGRLAANGLSEHGNYDLRDKYDAENYTPNASVIWAANI